MKPEWLVKPGYQALPQNTCQADQWSGMWQGIIVIRRRLTVGATGVLLSSAVVGEGDGSRVELESVPGPGGLTLYRARLSGGLVIEVTKARQFDGAVRPC